MGSFGGDVTHSQTVKGYNPPTFMLKAVLLTVKKSLAYSCGYIFVF